MRSIMPLVSKQIVRYGLSETANVRAENLRAENGQMHFDVVRVNGKVTRFPVILNLPGQHNVLNALAAIAVATEVGVPDASIAKALNEFKGVGRRFQRYGEWRCRPEAVSLWSMTTGITRSKWRRPSRRRAGLPGRRLVLAFQPHRYTRTRDCFEDFVKVLSGVDALLLSEVYAAGEQPIVAADGRSLARALRVAGKVEPVFVEDIEEMPDAILGAALDGDVVITMGAGSVGAVPGKLAANEE